MPDLKLRRLGPADLEALCAVPDGLFDNPVDRAQAEAFLASPLCLIVMAFADALPVSFASGTILLHPDKPPALFVNEVGTRDGWTRRGLATRVTEALLAAGREAGCTGAWLATETDNAAALGLYRRMGGDEQPVVAFGWDGALDA